MAKLTWFTYDTVMTTLEADTIIKKYTSQNIQRKSSYPPITQAGMSLLCYPNTE